MTGQVQRVVIKVNDEFYSIIIDDVQAVSLEIITFPWARSDWNCSATNKFVAWKDSEGESLGHSAKLDDF